MHEQRGKILPATYNDLFAHVSEMRVTIFQDWQGCQFGRFIGISAIFGDSSVTGNFEINNVKGIGDFAVWKNRVSLFFFCPPIYVSC